MRTRGVPLVLTALLATGCSVGAAGERPSTTAPAPATTEAAPVTSTSAAVSVTDASTTTAAAAEPNVVCTEPVGTEVYLEDVSTLSDPADDLAANLPADTSYFAWSTRDGPESDFAPCFHRAADSFFGDDSIVIGVEIDGEARAFIPDQLIAHVVNDTIGTTPLLVSY